MIDWHERAAYIAAAVVLAIAVLLARVEISRADVYPTVDVALVLAIDVSGSVSPDERRLQREGTAAALASPEVAEAIASGPHGRILVAVVEWSELAHVRVPWTMVSGPADVALVADGILADAPTARAGATNPNVALMTAAALFKAMPERAERLVVDVSGDGPGSGALTHRDVLLDMGATINGLPITAAGPGVEQYYRDELVGGPNAFVVAAESFDAFADAIRRKIVMELF